MNPCPIQPRTWPALVEENPFGAALLQTIWWLTSSRSMSMLIENERVVARAAGLDYNVYRRVAADLEHAGWLQVIPLGASGAISGLILPNIEWLGAIDNNPAPYAVLSDPLTRAVASRGRWDSPRIREMAVIAIVEHVEHLRSLGFRWVRSAPVDVARQAAAHLRLAATDVEISAVVQRLS